MSDACLPAASTSALSSRSGPQPCCSRIWFVYSRTWRSCVFVPPPLVGGSGVSLGVGLVLRVLVGVAVVVLAVLVGFGRPVCPSVLRGAVGRTITVVTPTVGAVGVLSMLLGVSIGVLAGVP